MTDNELRGLLLRWYYERRREHWVKPTPGDFEAELTERDISHITEQLAEHDLVMWSYADTATTAPQLQGGQITATGIDVVEGTSLAPIAVSKRYVEDNRQYHITGASLVQAGDHNTQTRAGTIIENLTLQMQAAPVDDETKQKALQKLERFASTPAVVKTLQVEASGFETRVDYEIHD